MFVAKTNEMENSRHLEMELDTGAIGATGAGTRFAFATTTQTRSRGRSQTFHDEPHQHHSRPLRPQLLRPLGARGARCKTLF